MKSLQKQSYDATIFAVVLYMLVKKGDYLKAKKEKSCKSFDLQDFGGERGRQ